MNFYAISSTRNGEELIQNILVKVWLQSHLLSDFNQKLIKINLCEDITKYKISWNFVLELHLRKIFCHTHCDKHTERHFPEIVESCLSCHPKTCKSSKNRKSKNCTKPILSANSLDEIKNTIFNLPLLLVKNSDLT